jgi:hypothetical protein
LDPLATRGNRGSRVRLKRAAVAALIVAASAVFPSVAGAAEVMPDAFFREHCYDCHDSADKKGDLDLTTLKPDFANAETFARWVKIYDKIATGEMPPKKKPRPPAEGVAWVTKWLGEELAVADVKRLAAEGRTRLRRLTRAEYENTIRDLFDLPGIPLQGDLPADGSAHGFDNNSEALDISHVNLAKYVESADRVLDMAIATRPGPPTVQKARMSLVNHGGFVAHVSMNGDAVLLKNKQPDPEYPPAAEYAHIDQGAHERMGSFSNGASVGMFRHEDESVNPYFAEFVAMYPGKYRVKTSFWSFTWDKGKVLPARGTEAARLSVVQLTGDGRGGQHPSYVLGYYDAPSLQEQAHELTPWLNYKEIIGFNTASLAPVANYSRKGRAMAFTGPGIACDYLEIEGPIHDVWPPKSHKVLFGDLPLQEWKKEEHPNERMPARNPPKRFGPGRNSPDPEKGVWTVHSVQPLADAERLLAAFLPKSFRRPVPDEVRREYLGLVEQRLQAGDAFETAMRWAYRAALCSPDFLYRLEPSDQLDDFALAARLSYFLWNSAPDAELTSLAQAGKLQDPAVLRAQTERLLKDAKSQRFVENFLGQWLKLRSIAANDPDKKLYPEFSPYLQDSMVAETRAYFRELLEKNLGAQYLVKSNFAMLNEKLATHYGIPGVSGSQIRRVPLPPGSPRGPFLTQASVLKITANGTTTSPVPRGAFVMARLLGEEPEPPPPNITAVEPDVRGATTIREQLDKHRTDAICASCHAKIDPPGFALESFDVIGGFRERYRSIGDGDPAPRGAIDKMIGISFKLGPKVDPSGETHEEQKFANITEFQEILAAHPERLLRNLAKQFAVYAAGRGLAFSDRAAIEQIARRTQKQGGGIRSLMHEIVQSQLFHTR